jgi:hypothetical protein
MKPTTTRLIFLTIFLLASLGTALGQGCFNWMILEYSTYESQTADATHIYTSVLIDGTTGGTCSSNGGCDHCGQIMNPPPVHTPKAYNVIASTGGWGTGASGAWNSYISEENDQTISATPGTQYLFNYDWEILCTLGGTLLNNGGNGYVSIANTKEQTTVPGQNTWCTSAPLCANTSNPRCKVSSIYEGSNQPCHPAHWCEFVAVSASGTAPYSCFLVDCQGSIDTTPGICTTQ